MALYLSTMGIAIVLMSLGNIFLNPHPEWSGNYPLYIVIAVVFSVAVEFAIDGIFASIIHAFPDKWFAMDKKCFQVGKKQRKFYEKIGIKKWKDKVWELGGLGGFRKNKIQDPNSPEYLEQFIIESNKGIVIHLVGMIVGPLVIFILPLEFALTIGLPIIIVNIFLNALSTFVLRYNLPKLMVAHKRAVQIQNRTNKGKDKPVDTSLKTEEEPNEEIKEEKQEDNSIDDKDTSTK